MSKRRVTITVEETLVEEALAAVAAGQATSLSAWVSQAMDDRQARDQRLERLAILISEFEAEHGEITEEELAEQAQLDRDIAAIPRSDVTRSR